MREPIQPELGKSYLTMGHRTVTFVGVQEGDFGYIARFHDNETEYETYNAKGSCALTPHSNDLSHVIESKAPPDTAKAPPEPPQCPTCKFSYGYHNSTCPVLGADSDFAGLIRAVLDGKIVQRKSASGQWGDVTGSLRTQIGELLKWARGDEYRVKPEAIEKWTSVCPNKNKSELFVEGFGSEEEARADAKTYGGVVQCTQYDPDTYDILDCYTEAP